MCISTRQYAHSLQVYFIRHSLHIDVTDILPSYTQTEQIIIYSGNNTKIAKEKDIIMKKIAMLTVIMLVIPLMSRISFAAETNDAKMYVTNSEIRSGEILNTILYMNNTNIKGFTCELDYDESILSLASAAPIDSNNAYFSINGKKILFYYNNNVAPGKTVSISLSFNVSEKAKTNQRLIVTAKNIIVSNGNADIKYENASCGINIMPPKSDNADILSLNVLNGSISPAFASNINHYQVVIPFSETELKLGITRSPSSKCEYYGNNDLSVGKNEVIITITAENGKQQDYIFDVIREQDPNYIKSGNAYLSKIGLSSGTVSPEFDPHITDYIVYVANETKNITINGVPQHNLAVCETKTFVLSPGNNPCKITCTAEDGVTNVTYNINVYRMPPYSGNPPVIDPTPTPSAPYSLPDDDVSQFPDAPIVCLIVAIAIIIVLCGVILFYMTSGKR